jgi:hypothetical protein
MLRLVRKWRSRCEHAAEDEALLTTEERAENARLREQDDTFFPGVGATGARVWEHQVDAEFEQPGH